MRIIISSEYVIAKHTGTSEKHYLKWTCVSRCIILNFVLLYFYVALKKIKKKKKFFKYQTNCITWRKSQRWAPPTRYNPTDTNTSITNI